MAPLLLELWDELFETTILAGWNYDKAVANLEIMHFAHDHGLTLTLDTGNEDENLWDEDRTVQSDDQN